MGLILSDGACVKLCVPSVNRNLPLVTKHTVYQKRTSKIC